MTQQMQTQTRIELLSIRRQEHTPGFGARIIVGARTYNVSRLDGEDGWTIDGETHTETGYVFHQNGFGARGLRTSLLAHEAALGVLNDARFDAAEGEGRR